MSRWKFVHRVNLKLVLERTEVCIVSLAISLLICIIFSLRVRVIAKLMKIIRPRHRTLTLARSRQAEYFSVVQTIIQKSWKRVVPADPDFPMNSWLGNVCTCNIYMYITYIRGRVPFRGRTQFLPCETEVSCEFSKETCTYNHRPVDPFTANVTIVTCAHDILHDIYPPPRCNLGRFLSVCRNSWLNFFLFLFSASSARDAIGPSFFFLHPWLAFHPRVKTCRRKTRRLLYYRWKLPPSSVARDSILYRRRDQQQSIITLIASYTPRACELHQDVSPVRNLQRETGVYRTNDEILPWFRC